MIKKLVQLEHETVNKSLMSNYMWIRNFMKRRKLTIRKITNYNSIPHENIEISKTNFIKSLNLLRTEKNISNHLIKNMDERSSR